MSKKLGDSLVVDLSVGSEEERIVNLAEMFNENPSDIPTVVATVDERSVPNTAPVSLILARDEHTLPMALKKGQTTTENLQRNGRISIEVLAAEDVVVGIRGSAELVRETMENNDAMSLWEIEVEEVKRDTFPAVVVTQGPVSKPRSEAGEEFESAMIREMRELIQRQNYSQPHFICKCSTSP